MKSLVFDYTDSHLSFRELWISIAAWMLGVGILSMPRVLSKHTEYFDGWICIIASGCIALLFAWIAARLAMRFPGQPFFQLAEKIVSRPVAYVLTALISLYFILIVAFLVRNIATISKNYLFDKTPVEVISLVFFLLVIYAVSGSRIGIVRLNLIFFPITACIIFILTSINVSYMKLEHLQPMLTTPVEMLTEGTLRSLFYFTGFEFILFYACLLRRPQEATKATLSGMFVAVLFYLLIYTIAIGVFGNVVTQNLTYPTIELAKEIEVPGSFFERLESIFFTIWILTIFNTAAIAYDVVLESLRSVVSRISRQQMIFLLSPLIFILAYLPINTAEVSTIFNYVGLYSLVTSIGIPTLLLGVAIVRGVKGHA